MMSTGDLGLKGEYPAGPSGSLIKEEPELVLPSESDWPEGAGEGLGLIKEEHEGDSSRDIRNHEVNTQMSTMEVQNIKFVGEVEKHPVLYDNTLSEYSRRDYTERAWHEVSKEVNLSVPECKEKWRNLRSTFARNFRPRPSGSGGVKRNQYYLADAMQFAIPFMRIGGTYPTASSPTLSEVIKEEEYENATAASQFEEALPGTSAGELTERPVRKRKPKNTLEAENAFKEYFTAKKKILDEIQPVASDIREEGIKHFLSSLVPDLIQLPDKELRIFKRQTLDLVDALMSIPSGLVYPVASIVEGHHSSPSPGNISILTESSGCVYVETEQSPLNPDT